jgi:hypothetical protein
MASGFSIRILLFLCICSSLMLIGNAMSILPFTDNNNEENLVLRRYKYPRPPIQFNSDLFEDSSSSEIQRRNVIMPRICYFARISGRSGHQKLCLPYTDNIKP